MLEGYYAVGIRVGRLKLGEHEVSVSLYGRDSNGHILSMNGVLNLLNYRFRNIAHGGTVNLLNIHIVIKYRQTCSGVIRVLRGGKVCGKLLTNLLTVELVSEPHPPFGNLSNLLVTVRLNFLLNEADKLIVKRKEKATSQSI